MKKCIYSPCVCIFLHIPAGYIPVQVSPVVLVPFQPALQQQICVNSSLPENAFKSARFGLLRGRLGSAAPSLSPQLTGPGQSTAGHTIGLATTNCTEWSWPSFSCCKKINMIKIHERKYVCYICRINNIWNMCILRIYNTWNCMTRVVCSLSIIEFSR